MSDRSRSLPEWFATLLWGNTVGLSWMWGLGLFFSVQFTSQFGLIGLLTFAIPNFLGLLSFGLVTQQIANRSPGSESLASFFNNWSRPFRLVFFLYQVLAITLTIFAIIRYVWMPLGLQPNALYLPLTLLIVLAAAILFGEEFNIKRIKFSHGVMAVLLLLAVGWLIFSRRDFPSVSSLRIDRLPTDDWNYWGYAIPIVIGFLVGPWLDLQQWQRAIQMQRERVSIAWAYVVGSTFFFALLIFHGTLTLWAREVGGQKFVREGLAGYHYGHDMLMRLFFNNATDERWTFVAYCVFVCICILTTLDSGYIALSWFLQSNVKASKSPIFSLLSTRLVTSPIPIYILCGLIALTGAVVGLELEYFMIFYATFFVGYSALAIVRCYMNTPANVIPQVKMFMVGSLAVVIFAYGYFLRYPVFQIIGSLLPLAYIFWMILKPGSAGEFVSGTEELESPAEAHGAAASISASAAAPSALDVAIPSVIGGDLASQHDPSGHFVGKWFVHSFVATYADTNSVGNVYFGMYAMWVGKTRELFFNKAMPKFNLRDTPFYILTRSFEHKFVRETREFERVSVRIRIADYNRKFVMLEHEIYDSRDQLLGKGKQSLIFVSSSDYRLLDVPVEVSTAFIAYA